MTFLAGIGVWLALVTVTALALWRAAGARAEAVRRACHELRGPLTAVRLGLELERRARTIAPARLRAMDLELSRAALALDELAELDVADVLGWRWERVDIGELVADSVEAWRPAAARRRATLALSWLGAPVDVRGDRIRLAQAVGNLIANALEHGGGRVQVRGRTEDGKARIEILDEGPGLRAPVSELVRRGRRWGAGRPRGHGLRIAQAVATAHGGRLAAAPSERGARLVLELPAASAEAAAG
jgi:signal transduction histidine kinase